MLCTVVWVLTIWGPLGVLYKNTEQFPSAGFFLSSSHLLILLPFPSCPQFFAFPFLNSVFFSYSGHFCVFMCPCFQFSGVLLAVVVVCWNHLLGYV